MENLGAYLQKLREDKGLSYKNVHKDLLLREDQVRMIEENRFFELGPFGMTKAMVHKYARYLEADLDAVMCELMVMMPENTKKEFKPKRAVKEKKLLISPNFLWLIGIIIFVILLGAILWHSYQRGWLKTPELFKAAAADTTVVLLRKVEPAKPDSNRIRQKQITEAPVKQGTAKTASGTMAEKAVQDSTDYLGEILGNSQVNVPLH